MPRSQGSRWCLSEGPVRPILLLLLLLLLPLVPTSWDTTTLEPLHAQPFLPA